MPLPSIEPHWFVLRQRTTFEGVAVAEDVTYPYDEVDAGKDSARHCRKGYKKRASHRANNSETHEKVGETLFDYTYRGCLLLVYLGFIFLVGVDDLEVVSLVCKHGGMYRCLEEM